MRSFNGRLSVLLIVTFGFGCGHAGDPAGEPIEPASSALLTAQEAESPGALAFAEPVDLKDAKWKKRLTKLSPCKKCGPKEFCVQYFGGVCFETAIKCVKVSDKCRTEMSKVKFNWNCPQSCDLEACERKPYTCAGPPCGTERPDVDLVCYGP